METSTKNKKWSTKENPILKTWKKMKSLGHMSSSSSNKKNKTPQDPSSSSSLQSSSSAPSFTKSRSWHCSALRYDHQEETSESKNKKDQTNAIAPQGCFTVYVGPKKDKFWVKAKQANHPSFQILLEHAEKEYGYRNEGPIVLPCEVDLFIKTLAEMESRDEDDEDSNLPVCGFCSPYRSFGGGTDSRAMKRYRSYKILRTPSSFKLNSV